MSAITIRGQVGKSLPEIEVPFSDVAASGRISFRSQAPDDLSFVIEPKLITASGSKIPEVGQRIELFIGGTRQFCGVVTRIPSNWEAEVLSVSVAVEGPWWNLEKTPLTDLIPDVTKMVERPQFRCPKGNIRDHIIRLLQRAISVGVPIEIGEIAACYDCPTTTFRDGSFAYALAELARLIPDSVIWWDYSGTGNPKFNLSRRDPSQASTFVLGSDDITSIDLTPELDLKVERVTVESATRAIDGSVEYRSLNAGINSDSRQIVTVSGPELAEILPPDPLDSVTISTEPAFFSPGSSLTHDSIKKIWKLWVETETSTGVTTSEPLRPWGFYTLDDDRYDQGVIPKYYREDGSPILGGDDEREIVYTTNAEAIPQWFVEQVGGVKGSHKGSWYLKIRYYTGSTIWNQLTEFERVMWQKADFYDSWIEEPSPGLFFRYLGLWFNLDVPFVAIAPDVTDVTYWQAPAYTFEAPPSDYAANLLAAQNFLPYSGGVDLQLQPGGFIRRSGVTLNISGGLKPWESMGAIIQGETLDLETGLHSLEVGVPGLRSGLNSVSFIKRDPADNVIIL